MADFVTAFGNSIGRKYPHRNTHTNQIATAEFGPDGLRLNTQQQTLWQFRQDDRARAVLVGPDFILLHCGKGAYTNHADFIGELASLITKLSEIPGIVLTHVTSIGYRYVDLIQPAEDKSLHEYLQPWAIPSDIPPHVVGDLEIVEGTSVSIFKTSVGMLRFQAHRHPPATLPGDLDSPFMRENGWVTDRPAEDFVLLDFDHGRQFVPPMALNVDEFKASMVEVCQPGRKLFHESIKEFGREVWEAPT